MLPSRTLVASSIVARQPCHQLLSVGTFDVRQEGDSSRASEGGRSPAVVHDHDLVAAVLVGEPLGSAGHRTILTSSGSSSARRLCRLELTPGSRPDVAPPSSRSVNTRWGACPGRSVRRRDARRVGARGDQDLRRWVVDRSSDRLAVLELGSRQGSPRDAARFWETECARAIEMTGKDAGSLWPEDSFELAALRLTLIHVQEELDTRVAGEKYVVLTFPDDGMARVRPDREPGQRR